MKQIEIAKLKTWEDNPRDLTDSAYNQLIGQLRLGEIQNLIVLKDGTVLNGNMRLRAYTEVGIDKATVAEVEFKPTDDGRFSMFVDGVQAKHYHKSRKGEPTLFESELEGMLAIALASNTHVGTFSDQLVEMLSSVNLDQDLYQVHMTPGTRVEDLVRAVSPISREEDESEMAADLEVYEHGTIKQIVVYFTNDQYITVIQRINILLKELDLQNNTMLFLKALEALEQQVEETNK